MNIIKFLRKPHLAILLASLIFTASCTQNEVDFLENSKSIDLEKVVTKHLELSKELAIIFKSENNMNLTILNKSPDFFNNIEEFEKTLIKAKVINVKKITNLVSQIQTNLNAFLEHSRSKDNFNQKQITEIITKEITQQTEIENGLLNKNPNPCTTAFNSATNTCLINYTISLAGAAVSAFFSAGIGTIIGVAVATGINTACLINASNAQIACNQQNP